MTAPSAAALAHTHDAASGDRASATASALVAEYVPGAPRPLRVRRTASLYADASWQDADYDAYVAGTLFDPADRAAALGLPGGDINAARLAVEAFRRDGDSGLASLSGRFILLIADRHARRLVAVRDQMGLFPLFYARTRDGLILSTSCAALADHPDVSRTVNRLVVAEHLAHRWIDANETYFAAVRRVPPGHLLDVHGHDAALRRYWDPGADGFDEGISEEESLDRFNRALRRAVERCLGPARTGILLSGGFDSVSVAATASAVALERRGAVPHALSVVFPDPECNEELVQRSVARTLGVTQELLPLGAALRGQGLLASALEMGRDWPAPMLNLWLPAYRELVSRGVRAGCDTVLTGTGGDEWLNVTPAIAADLIRAARFAELAEFAGVFRRSFRLSRPRVLATVLWTFGVRRLIGRAAASAAPAAWQASRHRREIAKTPAWVAPDAVLRREMDARAERLVPPAHPGTGGYYEHELQVSLTHPLVALEYEEHFEFGQRTGAPLLSPYLDPDLVRLLYRMDPRTLIMGGRSKGLVRSAVSAAFPGLGFERQKKVNANRFFRDVLRAEGPVEWHRHGGVPALGSLGVIDPGKLDEVAADLFAGHRPEQNYVIWHTLNVDGWIRSNTARS